jgi:hypothetical protein
VTHPHTKALAELVAATDEYNSTVSMNDTAAENDAKLSAITGRYLNAWSAARAALALPQEQAPGAEPVTDAAWEVTNQGRYIYCDRFEHDIRLTIDGDFESDAERVAFAKACAVKLCSAPSSPGAAEAGEAVALSDAARDVLAERQRQVGGEGWTPEHDDEHDRYELARAAAAYSLIAASDNGVLGFESARRAWPWESAGFKPKDRRSNLVRAGALAIAEIERLDRAEYKRLKEQLACKD